MRPLVLAFRINAVKRGAHSALIAATLLVVSACNTNAADSKECHLTLEAKPLRIPASEVTEDTQAEFADYYLEAVVLNDDGEPEPDVEVNFSIGDGAATEASATSGPDGVAKTSVATFKKMALFELNARDTYTAHIDFSICGTVYSEPASISLGET